MKVSICDKCKGFDYKKVIKELDSNYKDITYQIGCNNMCGIGRKKIVVIVDNKPVIAASINELIDKIKTS